MEDITITLRGTASSLAPILALLAGQCAAPVAVVAATGQSENPLPEWMTSLTGTATLGTVCQPTDFATLPVAQPQTDFQEVETVNLEPPTFDSAGLPWDARIHGEAKNLNADKTWRKKRKVDPALVAAVEAELRANLTNAAAPVLTHMTATPSPLPVAAPMPVPLPLPTPSPMPTVTAEPVAMVSQAVDANNVVDFATFMQHLSPKIQAGLITSDDLQAVVVNLNTMYGVEMKAITDLLANQAMISTAIQLLIQNGKW